MFRKGDYVKVIAQGTHQYKIGDIFKVIDIPNPAIMGNTVHLQTLDGDNTITTIRPHEVVKTGISRKQLEEVIARRQEKITDYETRLAFIEEFNREEFDYKEYAVHMALQLMSKGDMSKEQKLAELKRLIKEK